MFARTVVRSGVALALPYFSWLPYAHAGDDATSPPSASFSATPAPAQATAPAAPMPSSTAPAPLPPPNAAPLPQSPPTSALPSAQPPGVVTPQATVPVASPPSNAPGTDYARLEWERAYAAWYASGWRPPPSRRWYGWQTLLVDVASLGLWIGGALSSQRSGSTDAVVLAGVVAYEFAAPIVHAAHGHWGKAGGSFGLRVGTTILGVAGAVGCTNGRVSECDGGSQFLLLVGGLGLFAIPIVDAVVIANEDIEPEEGTGLKLVPWMASVGRGGGMSVARRW